MLAILQSIPYILNCFPTFQSHIDFITLLLYGIKMNVKDKDECYENFFSHIQSL